ncbi:MAG: dihydrofolate reductase [Rhizobiaceae bacterium]|nr:dihydrofolate reductase [Rhizobiaceae bacterium]
MDIVIHAAVADNGVIGREGGLPWRLSTDMKRFKAGTMGRPVIMGRKTWESFPKRPLPGRLNIVITRDPGFPAEGAETAASLEDALTLARVRSRCMTGADEICVIGGGQIYAQAMGLADRLAITHVHAKPDGDTHFPAIDPCLWRAVSREDVPAGDKDSHTTSFILYEKRNGAT